MHANNISHFAIHVDDVDRARTFYEAVFGWRFEAWGPPDFYLIRTGTEASPGIMGALQKRSEPRGAGFSGFECTIAVANVNDAEAKIVKHGGSIIVPRVAIPRVGMFIKFADTEGNIACAMQYFPQT